MQLKDISISALKVNQRLSEETLCFSANLLFGGRKVAELGNRGHGGPNEWHWTDAEAKKEINDWANSQTIMLQIDGRPAFELKFEKLDHFVMQLIEVEQARKILSRHCAKKTLFRLPGDAKGSWRTFGVPFDTRLEAHIVAKYPNVELIANKDINAAIAFA